jgi:RimJ/RimL family protein N-acetyltransferase
MTLSKGDMIISLPIRDGDLTIRTWVREDAEALAMWPSYPPDYAEFNLAYCSLSPADRERRFAARDSDPTRVDLIADLSAEPVVGYLALVEIDWATGSVGNMAFRVKPARCDQGLGTRVLQLVTRWCFEQGMARLRLDVAASNTRAIRCYEKADFIATGEFWREDEALRKMDLGRHEHAALRPHIRFVGSIPQVRFFWMERHVKDAPL